MINDRRKQLNMCWEDTTENQRRQEQYQSTWWRVWSQVLRKIITSVTLVILSSTRQIQISTFTLLTNLKSINLFHFHLFSSIRNKLALFFFCLVVFKLKVFSWNSLFFFYNVFTLQDVKFCSFSFLFLVTIKKISILLVQTKEKDSSTESTTKCTPFVGPFVTTMCHGVVAVF